MLLYGFTEFGHQNVTKTHFKRFLHRLQKDIKQAENIDFSRLSACFGLFRLKKIKIYFDFFQNISGFPGQIL